MKNKPIILTDSYLKRRLSEAKTRNSSSFCAESGSLPPEMAKIQRIADLGHKNLSIEIRPNGGMSWRFRYTFNGKSQMLSLGTFPEISITEARKRAVKGRENVALGIDPSRLKKAERSVKIDTFEKVVREWHRVNPRKLDPKNADAILRRFEQNVIPYLGQTPIAEITTADLYPVLMKVWNRGSKESSDRLCGWCYHVFKFARGMGMELNNPVTKELRENFKGAVNRNFSALTDPNEIKGLVGSILDYKGSPIMRSALQMWIMCFVRPGNLRHMEWSEIHGIDTDKPEWRIPGQKMKMTHAKKQAVQRPFVVPLSSQAVEVIKDLWPLTGNGKYLFPTPRSIQRPMSENGILSALRRMGYTKDEMTGHGIRATARTLCREVLKYDPDVIEEQLAHGKGGALGTAYDRAEHMESRRKLMQDWSNWLYSLVANHKRAS